MTERAHSIIQLAGGANGAYGIGVMEALYAGRWRRGAGAPVEAELLAGSSVGAYCAAIVAARADLSCLDAVRALRALWLERICEVPGRRPNGVYRVCAAAAGGETWFESLAASLLDDAPRIARRWLLRGIDLAFSEQTLLRRALRLVDLGDAISAEPLERLIRDTVDLRRLLAPEARTLKITATNWDTGEATVFHNRAGPSTRRAPWAHYRERRLDEANGHRAILASASVPTIFPRVWLDGGYYVDGGVVFSSPLALALDEGISTLHVIQLQPALRKIPFGRTSSTIESLERLLVAAPASSLQDEWGHVALYQELARLAGSVERVVGDPAAAIGGDDADRARVRGFLERFAGRPRLAVHRYVPSREIGGVLGYLDFRLERAMDLVELGFQDAVEHDCERAGCLI